MTTSVQALVALDSEVDRGLIDTLVAGQAEVVVLDYLDIGGSTSSGYGAGDVLIVACADYNEDTAEYVKEAVRQHPARPVVLLCQGGENGYLREAFGIGVDDIVMLTGGETGEIPPGLAQQLAFTLEKAIVRRRRAQPEEQAQQGRVICVLGLKGGAGKTLTTANLGAALAAAKQSVAIVDLDLQFGDIALTMGLPPERTIYDLVRSGGSLDAEKLRDFMVEHSSGAHALLAPLRPDHAALINATYVREVLRLLHQMYDYVLVDTPPNFSPEVISAIDASTDIVMVATRDTLALKNTKLGLETLERMDYDRRHIRIVLNRANTKVGIDRQDILGILGRDVDVVVPSHRDITRSVNQGVPIATQGASPGGRAFTELADAFRKNVKPTPSLEPAPTTDNEADVAEAEVVPEARARRRLFGRGQ